MMRILPAIFLFGVHALQAVEIVGHRGASRDAPENTLSSFNLCWGLKADAAELDIHLTKDGRIVVIHDKGTERTTGKDFVVADHTLAELKTLDAGSWKGKEWAGERIPTLAEVLDTIPDGKRLFIEIKCGPEVLPELERVLKASGKKPDQLVLIGFMQDTMRRARQSFPQLKVLWLVSPTPEAKSRTEMAADKLIEAAKAAHFDGLCLNADFPMDAAVVAKVRDAGMTLHVWTVDEPTTAGKLAAAGVDGIITNRPGWLRQQLER